MGWSWSRRAASPVLLLPTAVLVGGAVLYPLARTVWLSLTNAEIGDEGSFVGAANFGRLAQDPAFAEILRNTLIYTAGATLLKALIGGGSALLLLQPFRGRRLVYGLLCLPFLFPVVSEAVAWYYLLTPVRGAFDWALTHAHLAGGPAGWLVRGPLPMLSAITVAAWHGSGLFLIVLAASLKAIPDQVFDAAKVDGAGPGARLWHIALPLVARGLAVAGVLSLLGTFGDFAVIQIITRGGPLNQTQVTSTYAFLLALQNGEIGLASAAALSSVPVYLAGLAALHLVTRRS